MGQKASVPGVVFFIWGILPNNDSYSGNHGHRTLSIFWEFGRVADFQPQNPTDTNAKKAAFLLFLVFHWLIWVRLSFSQVRLEGKCVCLFLWASQSPGHEFLLGTPGCGRLTSAQRPLRGTHQPERSRVQRKEGTLPSRNHCFFWTWDLHGKLQLVLRSCTFLHCMLSSAGVQKPQKSSTFSGPGSSPVATGQSNSNSKGLIPFPFFSTIALFRNRICFPWGSDGFLERFGSLERMEMEGTP